VIIVSYLECIEKSGVESYLECIKKSGVVSNYYSCIKDISVDGFHNFGGIDFFVEGKYMVFVQKLILKLYALIWK